MSEPPVILIIEDEILAGLALADTLTSDGFDVIGPFNSTEKANTALDKQAIDGAFLDINLGQGRTSYEVATRLKDAGTPFVFLTGYSEISAKNKNMEDASYLAKPVSPERALEEARRMVAN